jgi:hypothetical protein
MTFSRGFTAPGPAKDNDGFVGKVWFEGPSAARSFVLAVYEPGAIAGEDLSTCGLPGPDWVLTQSPSGRSVCWAETVGGIYSTRYVANGTIYEVSGADGYPPSPTQRVTDRAWAVGLVDSYRDQV